MFGIFKKIDAKIIRLTLDVDILYNENAFHLKKIKESEKKILELQWQINNPPKHKVGQQVKPFGKCTYLKICDRMGEDGIPAIHGYTERFYYKYTFTKNNKNIIVCE